MSSIACFYLLTTEQLNELGKIANELPQQKRPRPGERLVAVPVAPGGLREKSAYDLVWDYLHQHGREPFKFKWSGFVLALVLPYLQEKIGIDWMQSVWQTPDELWAWYILDKAFKEKYLDELNPAKFSEEELGAWAEEFMAQSSDEAGEPMLDGIRIIRDYLAEVGHNQVLLFHVG